MTARMFAEPLLMAGSLTLWCVVGSLGRPEKNHEVFIEGVSQSNIKLRVHSRSWPATTLAARGSQNYAECSAKLELKLACSNTTWRHVCLGLVVEKLQQGCSFSWFSGWLGAMGHSFICQWLRLFLQAFLMCVTRSHVSSMSSMINVGRWPGRKPARAGKGRGNLSHTQACVLFFPGARLWWIDLILILPHEPLKPHLASPKLWDHKWSLIPISRPWNHFASDQTRLRKWFCQPDTRFTTLKD